ncbi:NUDIX hydrolase [Brevibacillus massiliensis]|jgi:ADP-ribose pyrophosphatase YjhB (NUDIX family)|uniref:NUDIX hydrolase n=1 Tax=Brevibacillus massiliensis TaxID=1118054 RepID=UPI0003027855|nr:NUDIX domain-containing protein [Brevibacillus massiliensis]
MRESKVWLAAAGIVVKGDEALVVKKTYGGMKGKWSFPAGFVAPGETVDQAAVREVQEETGIEARVRQVVAIRTGVIRDEISDNMVIFLMDYVSGTPRPQPGEIETAQFMPIEELSTNPLATEYLRIILPQIPHMAHFLQGRRYQPDPVFGYTDYKIFS